MFIKYSLPNHTYILELDQRLTKLLFKPDLSYWPSLISSGAHTLLLVLAMISRLDGVTKCLWSVRSGGRLMGLRCCHGFGLLNFVLLILQWNFFPVCAQKKKKKSGPNLYLKKGPSIFWELGSLLGSHYTRLWTGLLVVLYLYPTQNQ